MFEKNVNSESKYYPITRQNVQNIPQWGDLPASLRQSILTVSRVFPFRANNYVVNELIDWGNVPDDPIYRLTFPHNDMLNERDFKRMTKLVEGRAPDGKIRQAADEIRLALNPHPAGQLTHNEASLDGEPLDGIQHKYSETVLYFPKAGQTCHAFCTFCFRWAQFINIPELKMASSQIDNLVRYIKSKPQVSDVLFTGGDPMVMRAGMLAQQIEPLLGKGMEQLANIRIGTKSLTYWPYRYLTDPDADDILRLFEKVVASGRQLALMAHFEHPRELGTKAVQEALKRIQQTGAVVRVQAPILRHINDSPDVWEELWRSSTRLGAVPYYMFVARDTGPRDYFKIPLVKAWEVFREAVSGVSGLARTVRGPSMSATPGKLRISGVSEVGGKKLMAMDYLQARDASLVGRPFFAKYDPQAAWLDDLRPASASDRPFFPRHGRELSLKLA